MEHLARSLLRDRTEPEGEFTCSVYWMCVCSAVVFISSATFLCGKGPCYFSPYLFPVYLSQDSVDLI